MTSLRRLLGEILISKGQITPEQLQKALEEQKRTKEFLGAVLLKKRLVNEKQLAEALSVQFEIPNESLKNLYVDWDLVHRFPASLIVEHRCFPVRKEPASLWFAVTNPPYS